MYMLFFFILVRGTLRRISVDANVLITSDVISILVFFLMDVRSRSLTVTPWSVPSSNPCLVSTRERISGMPSQRRTALGVRSPLDWIVWTVKRGTRVRRPAQSNSPTTPRALRCPCRCIISPRGQQTTAASWCQLRPQPQWSDGAAE